MATRDFQTQLVRLGTGGLNQRPEVDVVPQHQLTRGLNLYRNFTGGITGRAGMTPLATTGGATAVHSIARMNDVANATFTRVWGIGTELYFGASGALTLAETGFSGDPLTMIPGDPPIPGEPWIYVADSVKMRKIRIDGLDFIIGLPPGILLSTVAQTLTFRTDIDDFEAADYNLFAGDGGGDPPTQALVAGMVGMAVEFTTVPGAAPAEYSSLADKAFVANLDEFSTGGVTVLGTPEDLIHIWARTDGPDFGALIIYFITGAFTSGQLPGTGTNTNYYAFSLQAMVPTVWKEFNIRRGDFAAVGSPDWADVQGIAIVMGVDVAAGVAVNVLDDWYITPSNTAGGVVVVPYDWRVTNYDPRTGVEGNPSPIQPESAWLDNLQSVVIITPVAFGDAAIRQRAYRRGNTLPDNWYFVGENTSDGGPIADANTDQAIESAPTVQIDHDQPVTSQDDAGTTVLAQPIPIIFGPVSGLYFGLGDPSRPSMLYWTLSDRPDYWPALYQKQVTNPSEFLQNGCVWGGEGYVATPLAWYRLIPNLSDSSQVNILPSGATKGMATRWAMVVGPDGVHYLGNDGWYMHTGGPQVNLSDAEFWPLFNGQAKNGIAPIDWTVPTQLRMGATLTEVWLQYQNTDGDTQHLIRNVITGEWRIAQFVEPTAVMVGEAIGGGQALTLLGGLNSGDGYTNTGTTDNGDPIPVFGRTASLDQGAPRNTKQYGDIPVSYIPNGVDISVQAFLDDETVALGVQILPNVGTARRLEVLDPFGGEPTPGRNIALEFSWETDQPPPVLEFFGPSFLVQPDTTVGRITDWDNGGSFAEKLLKGILLDCDTRGVTKTLVIEGTLYDGAIFTVATIDINANGRRNLAATWPMVPVSFVRIRPTDADDWIRWSAQWVFDEQPLRLARWETDQLTFGVEWSTCLYAYLCLQSSSAVTLTHTQWNEAGVPTVTAYLIPSTGGLKQRLRQTFEAGKGVLHKFVFTGAADTPFVLFREESHLMVKPWGGENLIRHPWGNDDLSLVRGMQSAEGTAQQPGGGT